MIRIIKEGYVPKYRARCKWCGCEFEFDEYEIENNISPDEIHCMVRFVRCPTCFSAIQSPQWNKEEEV